MYLLGVGKVMGSTLGPNRVRVGGLPWPQTGAAHYHAHLGLPDKGCEIKGLVV